MHNNECAEPGLRSEITMDNHSWTAELRLRFPEWLTEDAKLRWDEAKRALDIGQAISGEVVSRAPFGVWLDIGTSFPALLLVPDMKDAQVRRAVV